MKRNDQLMANSQLKNARISFAKKEILKAKEHALKAKELGLDLEEVNRIIACCDFLLETQSAEPAK